MLTATQLCVAAAALARCHSEPLMMMMMIVTVLVTDTARCAGGRRHLLLF